MRVAVVGSGVSGLLCAHWLHRRHDVTVYESDSRIGGHVNTVRVDLDDETHQVDTGFIVYNRPNYPILTEVFRQLGVATQATEMSFSVSVDGGSLEYRGDRRGLWAQPANAIRPSFNRMLADIFRFNRSARGLIRKAEAGSVSLGELLSQGRFGKNLARYYVVPLGSAIWSADPGQILQMPALTFARFLDNHGFLRVRGRPEWRTVCGGSSTYVERMVTPFRHRVRTSLPVRKVTRDGGTVTVLTKAGPENFDAVILSVHADQALGLLSDPSRGESKVLGSIRYQLNVATLHTDDAVLPARRRAWASWNTRVPSEPRSVVEVTYWMNNLQRITSSRALLVSLNLDHRIDHSKILGRWSYSHPVYDQPGDAARSHLDDIQGRRGTWFCGAYAGYGFHEDGAASAAAVCKKLGAAVRI